MSIKIDLLTGVFYQFFHLMVHLRYFLLSLFALQRIASSSFQSNTQKDRNKEVILDNAKEWNPKLDPVYDPVTKLCHFDVNPGYKFTPERYISTMKEVKTFYQSPNNNFTYSVEPVSQPTGIPCYSTNSYESEEELNVTKYQGPSTQSPMKQCSSSDSSYFASEDYLYVPAKCQRFERMWDFIIGDLFDMEPKIIGWVSRIGFADNFIREMAFPMKSATYSLIPHRALLKKSEILDILPDCRFTEFECASENLFHNLYVISNKVDKELFQFIVAINITYDKNGTASIKIIMKPNHSERVCRQLSKVHSKIIR